MEDPLFWLVWLSLLAVMGLVEATSARGAQRGRQESPSRVLRALPAPSRRRLVVLVIEPHDGLRAALRTLVRREGHAAFAAPDTAAARVDVDLGAVDLVLANVRSRALGALPTVLYGAPVAAAALRRQRPSDVDLVLDLPLREDQLVALLDHYARLPSPPRGRGETSRASGTA